MTAWNGPWGTTYASNLRLYVQDLPEDGFVSVMRMRKTNPPMPWPTVPTPRLGIRHTSG